MTQPPNSDVERVAEVLPCPFCGAESVPAMAMNMQGTRYYRQCNNCNMQGPDGKTREERDTAWNQRAALQPSGGDAVAAERKHWHDAAEAKAKHYRDIAGDCIRHSYSVNDEMKKAEALDAFATDIRVASLNDEWFRARTPTPQEKM